MIRTMLAMFLGLGPGADATKDNVNKPATIHIRGGGIDKNARTAGDGISTLAAHAAVSVTWNNRSTPV
jgi:hypothetical protein